MENQLVFWDLVAASTAYFPSVPKNHDLASPTSKVRRVLHVQESLVSLLTTFCLLHYHQRCCQSLLGLPWQNTNCKLQAETFLSLQLWAGLVSPGASLFGWNIFLLCPHMDFSLVCTSLVQISSFHKDTSPPYWPYFTLITSYGHTERCHWAKVERSLWSLARGILLLMIFHPVAHLCWCKEKIKNENKDTSKHQSRLPLW